MKFKECLNEVVNKEYIKPIEPENLRPPMPRRKKILILACVLGALVLAAVATAAISILTVSQSHRELIARYFQAIERADGEAMESLLLVFEEEREDFIAWFEQAATLDADDLRGWTVNFETLFEEHLPQLNRFLAADGISFLPLNSQRYGQYSKQVRVLAAVQGEQGCNYELLKFVIRDDIIFPDPLMFTLYFKGR